MSSRRFPLWTALGVVLVVALIVGSGVLSSSPPTAAQRADRHRIVTALPQLRGPVRRRIERGDGGDRAGHGGPA